MMFSAGEVEELAASSKTLLEIAFGWMVDGNVVTLYKLHL